MKQSYFNLNVNLSWSKIMALVVLILAFWLDQHNDLKGQLFMYSLPFVTGLVVGKQGLDAVKEIKTNNKPK